MFREHENVSEVAQHYETVTCQDTGSSLKLA